MEKRSVEITHKTESRIRVLVMTAVQAEQEAVLLGLQGNPRFEVLVAGVGPIAAAASTAKALAKEEYSLVISAGIGGGFPHETEVGSLVVASEIIAADLGVETPDGFNSLDELGFGFTRVPVDLQLAHRVRTAMEKAEVPVKLGPVLTVSTVTGTAASAAKLADRVPGAVAEAMEGFGIALAAQAAGVPVLEIRAISNAVGPRDRTAWKIQEALEVLTAASSILPEVLV
ncbi:MAG TPA: futalosine hydrolase [Verrucomicrobiae bacterium]|nr:futalosine hydrolase [Verrucomicrobiae bacterium]